MARQSCCRRTKIPVYWQSLYAGPRWTDYRRSKVAIIEMLANAYDAGASSVCVQWPTQVGDLLSVTDDGTGLTRSEFDTRWRTLKYERVRNQGRDVCFPPDGPKVKRTAFGHNGKGRLARSVSHRIIASKLGRMGIVRKRQSLSQRAAKRRLFAKWRENRKGAGTGPVFELLQTAELFRPISSEN